MELLLYGEREDNFSAGVDTMKLTRVDQLSGWSRLWLRLRAEELSFVYDEGWFI